MVVSWVNIARWEDNSPSNTPVTISHNGTQGIAKGRTGRRRAEMPHIYMLYLPRRGEGRSERLMNCASATNTGRVNDHRD